MNSGSCDRQSFHSVNHSSDLLQQLKQMREDGILCDVVLQIGECRLHAHKVVLAGVSPFFAAMFLSDMLEGRSGVVELKDVDPTAMEALIEFAYTSQISFSYASVPLLVAASEMLQFVTVKQACCDYLQRCISPNNCLDLLHFTDTYSCPDLYRAAQLYSNLHFVAVSQQLAFLEMSLNQLECYLSSDHLWVDREDVVLEAALRWLDHDVKSRSSHAHQVLCAVRMPLLPPNVLLEQVWTHRLVSASPQCMELVRKALCHHISPSAGSSGAAQVQVGSLMLCLYKHTYRNALCSDSTMATVCINLLNRYTS